jgi:hypothetical protein
VTSSESLPLLICIQRPTGVDDLPAGEFMQTIEEVSRLLPPELRPRIEPVAPPGPTGTKVGIGEVGGVLLIISVLSQAVRPILRFITSLAAEARKRNYRRVKFVRRELTSDGITEDELIFEGNEELSVLEGMIQRSITRRSVASADHRRREEQAPGSADLEISFLRGPQPDVP